MTEHNRLEYWLDEKMFEIKLWYAENKLKIKKYMRILVIFLLGFLLGVLIFYLRRK